MLKKMLEKNTVKMQYTKTKHSSAKLKPIPVSSKKTSFYQKSLDKRKSESQNLNLGIWLEMEARKKI